MDNFSEWDATVNDHPALIKVRLAEISTALSVNRQTDLHGAVIMTKEELDRKKVNLDNALRDYIAEKGVPAPEDLDELVPVYEWVPSSLTIKALSIGDGFDPNSDGADVQVEEKFLKAVRRLCIEGKDPNDDNLQPRLWEATWRRNRIAFYAFKANKQGRIPIYEFGPGPTVGVFNTFQYQKQGVGNEVENVRLTQSPAFYVPSPESVENSSAFLMPINKYVLYSYPGDAQAQGTGRPQMFGSTSKIFFNSWIFADENYEGLEEGYELAPKLFETYYAFSGRVKFDD